LSDAFKGHGGRRRCPEERKGRKVELKGSRDYGEERVRGIGEFYCRVILRDSRREPLYGFSKEI